MKIRHFLSDGTELESIEGYEVPTDCPAYKVIAEQYAKKLNKNETGVKVG